MMGALGGEDGSVTVCDSPWAPFKHSAFKSLWLGSMAMYLATLMQSTAGAWLMVSLSSSPLLVGLVQTASSLPSFVLSLPGGVLADLIKRRRLLLITQSWLVGTEIVAAVSTYLGWIRPWSLLALTAALGMGFALQTPAWHTSQAEAVPRKLLPSALALGSASFNAARAVGPALAGLLVAVSGVSTVFAISAAAFVASLFSLLRWQPRESRDTLPPERLFAGLRTSLRYVRHSTAVRIQLMRTGLFTSAASGLWAELPLVARDELHFGARGYGLLLASLGIGAIAGIFLIRPVRAHFGLNGTVTLCVSGFAASVLTASYSVSPPVVMCMLIIAGYGWMIAGNTHLSAIQTAIPSWVRARVMSVYILVFQGAMAAGGFFWGAVAAAAGTQTSLRLSVVAVLVTLIVMRRYPARIGDESEMVLSEVADLPALLPVADSEEGPVAVEIEYRVRAEFRAQFVLAVQQLGKSRRRDGANVWRLYRDLSDSSRYIERFVVDSWPDYLRHRARLTLADAMAEERIAAYTVDGAAPKIAHFIAEGGQWK
jgi:MFS family permease